VTPSPTPETDEFWRRFRADWPDAPAAYHRPIRFDEGEVADELAALVVDGPKRATTTMLAEFESGREPVFPVPGMLWIVVDSGGHPRCVIRTTRVEVRAFDEVDAAFAWDEGEGDRSLAYWRDVHVRFFSRQAAASGGVFDGRTKVVLERFAVIWPRPDPGI
jgi:uncharacterized protein YhfF